MRILLREWDLSDEYIRFAAQIGADGFDIHDAKNVPGWAENGFPDERATRALLERLRRWGLGVYRVAPPFGLLERYLRGQPGGDVEADNLCRAVETLGKVGVPLISAPIHLGTNPGYRGCARVVHRAGYTMNGFDAEVMRRSLAADPPAEEVDPEAHFERCVRLYPNFRSCGPKALVPQ